MAKKREVEIKLRVEGLAGLLAKLRELGAECEGTVYEENTLYDTSTREFQKMQAILRIRRERQARRPGKIRKRGRNANGGGGLITYKGMVSGKKGSGGGKYKEREEIEYRVKNAGRIQKLFGRLGLRSWFRYEKYRTKYRLKRFPELHLDLDETPIGTFLELEGGKKEIDAAARELGYSDKGYIVASYFELYLEECERRGTRRRDMLFKRQNND